MSVIDKFSKKIEERWEGSENEEKMPSRLVLNQTLFHSKGS